MEQVNKQSSERPDEVSAAIVKPPESRECATLPSQNGSTTLGGEASSVKTSCGGVKLKGGVGYLYVYALGSRR